MRRGASAKNLESFANRQVQNLVNVFALVVNFEHLRLVARAFALVADQLHVGEKLHFDGDGAVALAIFAASTGNVEGKMSGREAALLGFGQRGE